MTAGATQAAVFHPTDSSLAMRFGGLPAIAVSGDPGGVSDSAAAGSTLTVVSQAFGPANATLPSSLFTGIPFITGLQVRNMDLPGANVTRTFSAGHTATNNAVGADYLGNFGGTAPLSGTATLTAFGGPIAVPVPLDKVGVGGTTTASFGTTPIPLIAGGGWTAGPAQVTGLSVNLLRTTGGASGAATTLPITKLAKAVTITTGDLTVNDPNANGVTATTTAVTLTGFDARTANGEGVVQLVTPVMADPPEKVVRDAGWPRTALFGVTTLRFVPEPGTLLLLGAGIAGLGVVRCKRA